MSVYYVPINALETSVRTINKILLHRKIKAKKKIETIETVPKVNHQEVRRADF